MKLKSTFTIILLFVLTTLFSQQESPKISANGLGTVSVFPNAAQVTLYLKFVKPTLKEAITENKVATKSALAVVRKYSQDTTAIKVSLIATDKLMSWNEKLKKDVFVGFQSGQRIIFTLNNLDEMQDFTEAIIKTRIYEIERVSYFHTEAAAYIKQAQEKAVADAVDTTKRLAKAAGVTPGNILKMTTDSSPENGSRVRNNSSRIQTFSKGIEISDGVSSSGELLTFSATVSIETAIKY